MFTSIKPFSRIRKLNPAKPHTLTVLGIDPGVSNMGLSVTEFRPDLSFSPLWAGKFVKTVKGTMNNLPEQFNEFILEFNSLLQTHKPHVVVIERFMNRGKFSGDQGEYVSFMVALVIRHLQQTTPNCIVIIVQPGVWKVALCRALGSDGKRVKGKRSPVEVYTDHCLAESHELDSYFMAHFAFSRVRNEKPFSHLSKVTGSLKLVEDFEKIATGKKKRCRK